MPEAPETLEGWYILHDIRRIDWQALRRLGTSDRTECGAALAAYAEAVCEVPPTAGSSAVYEVVGHKGDLMFIHLRPSIEELRALEHALDGSPVAEVSTQTYSYLSVVELSLHGAAREAEGGDPRTSPQIQRRLQFQIPAARHTCFYPMNKRRQGQDNWYLETPDERRRMMKSHGLIGHRYAERVTQLIGGSMGLDDWEWSVTLFAEDPLVFKKLVYDMRFDEVSARFGEFGAFYVGLRRDPSELTRFLAT